MNWTFTDISTDDPEGITIALTYRTSMLEEWTDVLNFTAVDGESVTVQYTFSPGDEDHFGIWVGGDDYLMTGEYGFSLDLEASSKL